MFLLRFTHAFTIYQCRSQGKSFNFNEGKLFESVCVMKGNWSSEFILEQNRMTKSFQRLQVFISMDSQFVVVKPTHCKENALWRIQDLSDGRAPSQRWECQPIIRPNFPTNCMKTRKHSSRMRTTRFYGWGGGV